MRPLLETKMKKTSGFTLIEIMISLAIFMVGAAGIISLLGISAGSHQRAIALSTASRLAEDLFAYYQSRMMIDDGSNNGLLPEEGGIPENVPEGDDVFQTSPKYPGFEYKVMFRDINPQSASGLPGAQPEIFALIYVRWTSEGNDFRVGEKDEDDPPNNFEGRVFYSTMLKKPW